MIYFKLITEVYNLSNKNNTIFEYKYLLKKVSWQAKLLG